MKHAQLANALEALRTRLPDSPIQYITLLVFLYDCDPINQVNVAEKIGMSTASLARAVATLGDNTPSGQGLIHQASCLEDRRVRKISLTKEGKNLIKYALLAGS